MRLTGLKPRLGLPTLAPVLSEEQKESMRLAMREHRMKRNRALRNTTHTEYTNGDKVLVFHLKEKGFVEEGEIIGWDPTHNDIIPRAYRVPMSNGTSRNVNQSWLTLCPPIEEGGGSNE